MQKIKLYIIFISVICLGFLIGLLVLINSLTPDRAGNVLLFYILFGGLVLTASILLGFFLRKSWGQRELLNQYLITSIRQGLWFTLLLTGSMFLLQKNLFSWLNALLLVLCLIFLEAYLLTKNY